MKHGDAPWRLTSCALTAMLAIGVAATAAVPAEGQTRSGGPVRTIMQRQPDFRADIIAERGGVRTPPIASIAMRGNRGRVDVRYGPPITYSTYWFERTGDDPGQSLSRRYDVSDDCASVVAAIAPWAMLRELATDPEWILEEAGTAVVDGHPCIKIRAASARAPESYSKRAFDDVSRVLILYAATDLRGLIVRVEIARVSEDGRIGFTLPDAYVLSGISWDVPRSLVRAPKRPEPVHGSPPICTAVTVDRTEIVSGDRVPLRAQIADLGAQHRARVTWEATDGRIVGSGPKVEFDTTGLAPGPYTITASYDDGCGHIVDCKVTLTVVASGDA